MFILYVLAFFCLLALNVVQFFLPIWIYKYLPGAGSLRLQSVLLQFINNTQEKIVLFIQPLFNRFTFNIAFNKEDPTRRLITEADSLTIRLSKSNCS